MNGYLLAFAGLRLGVKFGNIYGTLNSKLSSSQLMGHGCLRKLVNKEQKKDSTESFLVLTNTFYCIFTSFLG
jgi:hypothetical protein